MSLSKFLTVILLCSPLAGLTQYELNYVPLKTYQKNTSSELVAALKRQTSEEVKSINSRKRSALEKIYKSRLNLLINMVERNKVIDNDSLEQFVQGVMDKIASNNSLVHKPGKVLILRESVVNAICYGEGTTLITTGLLSRISNEGQLAFTLAHELAHFELNHVKNKILESVEEELNPEVKAELEKLSSGEVTEEGLVKIKKYVLSLGEFSRSAELEADSLGMALYKKAGYADREAMALLDVLGSSREPKYKHGKSLFDPLDFVRYPFQNSWLKDRPSFYSKRRMVNFFMQLDSIQTHPDINIRKAALRVADYDSTKSYKEPAVVMLATRADFEVMEAAYQAGDFDRCLHVALQLKPLYPKNLYLNTTIARILTIICETKMKGSTLYRYANPFVDYYPKELRTVNSFLYNVMATEIGDMAFNFLNQQDNFNPACEEHYFLLWKVCQLTQRNSVKEKIKSTYASKFPDGDFLSKMKEPKKKKR